MIKEEYNKEYNSQFGVLTFFATLLVIFGHTGISFGTFDWLFHFDTFHMPLFVFISGYFFKTDEVSLKNIFKFLKKKIRKLIIPFFVFNFLYGLLAIFLYNKYNIVWCHGDQFLYNLIVKPFTYGTDFFGFNSPAWFVLMLFWVELFIYILQLILNRFNCKHIIISMLLLIGSLIFIYLSRNTINDMYIMFLTRTIYMMFWFSIGILYKKYLEVHDKIPNVIYFFIIFLSQFILLIINNGHEMNAFIFNSTFTQNGIITIILAFNGIALYLRLSKIFSSSIGNSKLVRHVQKNSFNIMMHQIFGFFVLNVIFLNLSKFIFSISFNYNEFASNQFYRVYPFGHPAFGIIYAMFGLLIPLLISYFINFIKKRINKI